MPDLRIQTAIDNGDLPEQLELFEDQDPKQMELDFNSKELEPISFGPVSLTLNDMFNLTKFTELLEGKKKD